MPNSGIVDIKIDFKGIIYVATEEGVYQSNDEGINWQSLNDGLINTHVSKLFIDDNNFIYSGTRGGGLFRSQHPLTVINEHDISLNYHLSQNYPNPFNPSTIISWQLPVSSLVTLKVYDILGREAATLVNGEKPAGSYETEFDGYNLSTGIYFYQLQAGDYVETKKMILMNPLPKRERELIF